jgi:alpha-tubulin suppressor-like RCC1 family protein
MTGYSNGYTGHDDSRLARPTRSARRTSPAVAGCCAILIFALSGCIDELDLEADIGRTAAALNTANGLRFNSLGPNGMALNGMALNGMTVNGMALNGMALNGMALNGMALNGMALNGIELNGMALNGMALNGMALNGMALNGMALNGMALNGIPIGAIALFGQPLEGIQVGDFKRLIQYLSACALGAGQCIQAIDVDGSPITYCGAEGLDPGWADHPPDPEASGAVATCVIDRAAAAGDSATHEPVNVEQVKIVLRYLVECALAEGDHLTIHDENDAPMLYPGALGLAPEWRDGAPTPAGQRRVSACLAARSNAQQQPVHISLRGPGIIAGAVERDLYRHQEGAFWADLFTATPYVNTCVVSGGGLSGRVCAESGECGFTPMGECSAVCAHQDPGDRAYSGCDGNDEVINTFLALGSQIRFGLDHNCLDRPDGSAWCWGKNDKGQLGIGERSSMEYAPRQVVDEGHDWAEIIGGRRHTCGRTRDGAVWCWGGNDAGQLGDGTLQDSDTPVQVVLLGHDVASLSVARDHGCAHKTDGTLWCWGKNDHGQLGDGTILSRSAPVEVAAMSNDVARVAGGVRSQSTCAISNSGALWCWGGNSHGQLGDGTTTDRRAPVPVSTDASGASFTTMTDVCSGQRHTCARRVDGTLWCWGDDTHNQIGDGNSSTTRVRTRPVPVAFAGQAAAGGLACGDHHTCALRTDGTLWCWGRNQDGQLGSGAYTPAPEPVQVSALADSVASVICGSERTCARTHDDSLWCWGKDEQDLLFAGTRSATPVAVQVFCNGDGVCEPDRGEDAALCPADCG